MGNRRPKAWQRNYLRRRELEEQASKVRSELLVLLPPPRQLRFEIRRIKSTLAETVRIAVNLKRLERQARESSPPNILLAEDCGRLRCDLAWVFRKHRTLAQTWQDVLAGKANVAVAEDVVRELAAMWALFQDRYRNSYLGAQDAMHARQGKGFSRGRRKGALGFVHRAVHEAVVHHGARSAQEVIRVWQRAKDGFELGDRELVLRIRAAGDPVEVEAVELRTGREKLHSIGRKKLAEYVNMAKEEGEPEP